MMTVTHEIDGKVGVVTLAKPPHNLIDDKLIADLVTAYQAVVAEGCRAILLRSSMRHFCAGAEMASWGTGTRIHTDQAKFEAMLRELEDVPVPTVAAVNGGVLGGGLEVALTCDIIIAANTAFLGQVEVAVGLLPLLGGTQRLSQRAGVARAKEIAMLGRRYDAATLERWGLVNLVVADDALDEATFTIAEELAHGPTVAHAATKRLVHIAVNEGVLAADQAMAEIQQPIWASEDLKIGLKSFRENGPGLAKFTGR